MKKIINKFSVFIQFGQDNGSVFYKILPMLILRRIFSNWRITKIKSVAFLMPTKGIGDGIIFSGLLNYFHKRNIKVIVVCAERNVFFYNALSSVDVVIPFTDDIHKKNIKNICSDKIDYTIDMYGDDLRTPQRIKCLYFINARKSIAFNGNGVSRACFTKTIIYKELDKHLTHRAEYLFDILGLPTESIPYKIDFPKTSLKFADEFVSSLKGKVISFAPFASNYNRSLSVEKAKSIALRLSDLSDVSVIVLGSQFQLNELAIGKTNIHMLPEVNFYDACALIDKSEILLSVDTSFVHMANFFQKKCIALYNMEMWDDFTINVVFGPGYDKAIKIVSNTYLVRDIEDEIIVNAVIEEC